ncbi:MAG TPA: hypothetical protein VMU51_05705 [Mycobacteriales bacterium]|nr:hypothetical protein [Mycobacteriales bacterium]
MSAPTLAAAPARPPARWPRFRAWPVWPLLLVCAAYRLWYLTRPQALLDGDEAMTGLMVRRILAGHPYAFLADQHYNGAIEQYPQALVWAVLPQTPGTLRLPQVGLAVLACWLVFLVGRELLGVRRGWLAAALFAVGPFFLVWKGIRSHGAYPTAQVLGLLGIWLALRLQPSHRTAPPDRPAGTDRLDAGPGRLGRWRAARWPASGRPAGGPLAGGPTADGLPAGLPVAGGRSVDRRAAGGLPADWLPAGGLRVGRWPAGWAAAAWFGVVLGAAAWSAWTAGYLLAPAAVWLAPALRRRAGLLGPIAAGGLVGYLPALAWAVRHHELPLLVGSQPSTGPVERLRLLFGPVLREFVGVGYFDAAPGWPRALQTAAVLGLAAAYLAGCWWRRRGLAGLLLLRAGGDRRPADLLLLVPPVVVLFYLLSKYTWWAGEPRYLFAAYPALALGLAALPPRRRPAGPARVGALGRFAGPGGAAGPDRRLGARAWLGAAGRSGRVGRLGAPLVAAALVVTVGATSLATAARHAGDGDARRDDCLRTAGNWLADHGVTAAYSDYWTGMPLQLLAGDRHRLSVAPMNSGRAKFPALRYAADAAPPVYVLSRAPDPMGQAPDQVAAMDQALARDRVTATRTQVGCTTIYTDLRPARRPWDLGLGKPLPPGRR